MKQTFLLIPLLFFCSAFLHGQSVGIGTQTPDTSAIFEIKSSTKGILIPRMTQSQRISIASPSQGLMVYQTDLDTGFYYFKGVSWQTFSNGNSTNSGNIVLFNRRSPSTAPDELWRSNLDGSGQSKINIVLPVDLELDLSDGGAVKITPNNQKIIFQVRNMTTNQRFLYSCSIDGSNVIKIVDGPVDGGIELGCVN